LRLRFEVAGPALVIGWALALWVLERLRPYDRQPFLRQGFWTDLLGYTFVQSYVMALVIGQLIRWMDSLSGLSRLHLLGDWPIAGQVAFFVVTHDLYIYWFHRWQHRSPLLWRLHEAHHSNTSIDWVAGLRSHALEILINQTVEFAPIVLLGAAPQVAVLKGAVSAIWGMFIHANLDARLGWARFLINGPEMHRWHHAVDQAAYGKNFSTKLAVWDWIFGTAYRPDPALRKAPRYGLDYTEYPEHFPEDYFVQQAYAFRASTPLTAGSE